ncbi:hypothetical protein NC653_009273 [Populus alba x Populus x berolinensis]|uniref:Uncharacterized protein n=2 Tax=Populus alba x Populus x berolinensis TaxID=444605 RepID=A0AAD6R8S5_9ROSI|nr:hypothetical protein NC653_009273 [Populus alba x Populus x berolinensis]
MVMGRKTKKMASCREHHGSVVLEPIGTRFDSITLITSKDVLKTIGTRFATCHVSFPVLFVFGGKYIQQGMASVLAIETSEQLVVRGV